MTNEERKQKLAALALGLAATAVDIKVWPSGMPFDDTNGVGLRLTPGVIADIQALFPDLPALATYSQIVARLVKGLVEEGLCQS